MHAYIWRIYWRIVAVQLLSHVQLFVTPWTAAHQASLSSTVLEFAQTHVYWVGDAFQPSHPLLPPSPPALNLSQYHRLHRKYDFSINNAPNSCFKAFSLRATLMLLLQHSLSSSHQQKGAQDPLGRGLHVFIPGHKLTCVKETDVYICVNETEPQKQPGRPSTSEWLTKVQDDHTMEYDTAYPIMKETSV